MRENTYGQQSARAIAIFEGLKAPWRWTTSTPRSSANVAADRPIRRDDRTGTWTTLWPAGSGADPRRRPEATRATARGPPGSLVAPGLSQVNHDRQDARPRLLTPRRDLRDTHARHRSNRPRDGTHGSQDLTDVTEPSHATSLPPMRRALDAGTNR
jgi:hypothetical protein